MKFRILALAIWRDLKDQLNKTKRDLQRPVLLTIMSSQALKKFAIIDVEGAPLPYKSVLVVCARELSMDNPKARFCSTGRWRYGSLKKLWTTARCAETTKYVRAGQIFSIRYLLHVKSATQ